MFGWTIWPHGKRTPCAKHSTNSHPERPLNSKAALDAFFVARPDSPIDLLQILLEETEQQKILFTGHRGSGKSTELAKLSNKLQDKLIVSGVGGVAETESTG